MKLVVENLEVEAGAFRLRGGFEAPLSATSGVTALFGPSGAGKSLLLRILAGLVRPAAGRIALGERILFDAAARIYVPAHRREVGLAFQDARLFPHLTVRGNLEYAARRAPGRFDQDGDIAATASLLDLEDLLDRPVRNLSGGEKSRAALARALLSAPRLLLLDEPFAALDGRRRRAFLRLLRSLHAARGTPMVVVTHLVEDAAELADHVVTIRDGTITGWGPAETMTAATPFTRLLDLRDIGALMPASAFGGAAAGARGVWVRADSVLLARQAPVGLSARHVWAGEVESVETEVDGSRLAALDTAVGRVLARVTAEAAAELELAPGRPMWAVVKTHAV